MISNNFRSGEKKPDALYRWQVDYGVQDEDPLFPAVAPLFGFSNSVSQLKTVVRELSLHIAVIENKVIQNPPTLEARSMAKNDYEALTESLRQAQELLGALKFYERLRKNYAIDMKALVIAAFIGSGVFYALFLITILV